MSFKRNGDHQPIVYMGAFVIDDMTPIKCTCGAVIGQESHGILRVGSKGPSGFQFIKDPILKCACGAQIDWAQKKMEMTRP